MEGWGHNVVSWMAVRTVFRARKGSARHEEAATLSLNGDSGRMLKSWVTSGCACSSGQKLLIHFQAMPRLNSIKL